MVELPVHGAVAQLRVVLDAVLGTLHGHGSHAGGLAARGDVVLVERAGPSLDVAVERLLVLEPAAVRCVALISCPPRCAQDIDTLSPFLVRVANDHAPVVVAAGMGAVGVVWGDDGPAIVG